MVEYHRQCRRSPLQRALDPDASRRDSSIAAARAAGSSSTRHQRRTEQRAIEPVLLPRHRDDDPPEIRQRVLDEMQRRGNLGFVHERFLDRFVAEDQHAPPS